MVSLEMDGDPERIEREYVGQNEKDHKQQKSCRIRRPWRQAQGKESVRNPRRQKKRAKDSNDRKDQTQFKDMLFR